MDDGLRVHARSTAVVVAVLAMTVASGCGAAARVSAQAYDRCLTQARTLGVAVDVCEALRSRPTVAGWDARTVQAGWLKVSADCYRWRNDVTVCVDGKVTL